MLGRMTERGSYAKGIAKREEILLTALEMISHKGYRKTTIRELAEAVKLSQAGLLYYFGTKEELFIEILRKRDEVDLAAYAGMDLPANTAASTVEGILNVVRHNLDVPGLVRLYTVFSAEATDPDHPAHAYFQERMNGFKNIVASAIREQQEQGQLAHSLDPEHIAVVLLAATDGLQTQWLLNNELDMAGHIARLWNSLISH